MCLLDPPASLAAAGRRLAWQTNMGNADVKATFGGKKHELNVTTHQVGSLARTMKEVELSWG